MAVKKVNTVKVEGVVYGIEPTNKALNLSGTTTEGGVPYIAQVSFNSTTGVLTLETRYMTGAVADYTGTGN